MFGAFRTALLFAAALTAAGAAHAQGREDTIRFIVPYTGGGVGDAMARRIAEIARKQSGKVLVVENMGGAGGTIGAAAVARAKPDGHTIMLVSTSALTIGPSLNPVSYDPLKDFTAIRSVALSPAAIVATRQAPFKDLKGALDYARAYPGAVRYATPGLGSVAQLALENLQAQTGVTMTHVPYRGDGPAITDALGGAFELLVLNTPSMLPHVKSGALRALAVMEPKRLDVWPDVPTLEELGYKGMVYNSDFGIFAPAGLSADTARSLTAMISDAVSSPEFQQQLKNNFLLESPTSGKDYAAQVASEFKRNAEIIKTRKIAP